MVISLLDWIYPLTIYSFAALSIYAAIGDWQKFRIPNTTCMALLVLWPVYLLTSPDAGYWPQALIIAACILGLGIFAFSRGWVGAGDIKFLAVCSLYVPPPLQQFFWGGIGVGGIILCSGLLGLRYWQKCRGQTLSFLPHAPELAQKTSYSRQYAPYGVAIAAGCVMVALQLLINLSSLG